MSGKDCLLDTDIVIGLFANESSITEKIRLFPDRIFISTIVLGELFYGAEQSTRKAENVNRVEEFAGASLVLECDSDTTRLYGKIKIQLRIKGTPTPENDILIAALAEQHLMIKKNSKLNNIDS